MNGLATISQTGKLRVGLGAAVRRMMTYGLNSTRIIVGSEQESRRVKLWGWNLRIEIDPRMPPGGWYVS